MYTVADYTFSEISVDPLATEDIIQLLDACVAQYKSTFRIAGASKLTVRKKEDDK